MIAAGSLCFGCPAVGYEVHQGTSQRRDGVAAWLRLRRQGGAVIEDGAVSSRGRVCGTYVHGLFDDARFCRALVTTLRQRRGLRPLAEAEWLSQGAIPGGGVTPGFPAGWRSTATCGRWRRAGVAVDVVIPLLLGFLLD